MEYDWYYWVGHSYAEWAQHFFKVPRAHPLEALEAHVSEWGNSFESSKLSGPYPSLEALIEENCGIDSLGG